MKISKEKIARLFACAFFDVEKDISAREKYLTCLQTVAQLIDDQPKLKSFLTGPFFSSAEKNLLFSAVRLPKPIVLFLELIIEKKMIKYLKCIADHYEELVLHATGRVKATITVAHADDVSRETKDLLVKKLQKLLKKDIEPEYHVDPKILGGLLLQTNDLYVDLSLKKGLETIKNGV